jgi:hypothetical protein
LVTFASGTSNPLVSRYNITSGSAGFGSFPPAGSTMTLRTNKYGVSSKDFNPSTDKFRYYRSSTLYDNNSVDINTLLGLSSEATPITGGPIVYQAGFTVPPSIDGENLYLIWDMRAAIQTQLCYTDGVDIIDPSKDACCNCSECCYMLQVDNSDALDAAIIYFPNGYCGDSFGCYVYLNINDTWEICVNNKDNYTIIQGNPTITEIEGEPCVCNLKCPNPCETWSYFNDTGNTQTVSYISCSNGLQVDETVPDGEFIEMCALIYSIPPNVLSGEIGGTFGIINRCSAEGCCEAETCSTFTFDVISGTISVTYFLCNVGDVTVSLSAGTHQLCVQKPFLPQIGFVTPGANYDYFIQDICGCEGGGGGIGIG